MPDFDGPDAASTQYLDYLVTRVTDRALLGIMPVNELVYTFQQQCNTNDIPSTQTLKRGNEKAISESLAAVYAIGRGQTCPAGAPKILRLGKASLEIGASSRC